MKKRLILFISYYLAWVVLFVVEKPLFMLFCHASLGDVAGADWLHVPFHGLPLDLSVAGYATALWGLILLASLYVPSRIIRPISDWYTAFMLLVAVVAFVVDAGLFPYWGFHLDKTLFIYLRTPVDALASGSFLIYVVGLLAIAAMWSGLFWLYRLTFSRSVAGLTPLQATWGKRAAATLAMLVLTALLFLPIRGSVTVSTMNTGRVYFSTNPALNIAAVNPIFNLVESLSENTIASERYRYMDSAEARAIVDSMLVQQPSAVSRFRTCRPKNIVLLIMESFSANAVGTLAGEPGLTPSIDSLAQESIVFDRAYASSFRTDRGVVAVMSAFPGQPTSSLMPIPSKTQHLGFLSSELARMGYMPHFYYGGDEDFTNMRSYLIAGGMTDRVCDKSFPIEQRLSKWGVHDHTVLDYAADCICGRNDTARHLDVVLTLSSHEPFEVPASQRHENDYLNSIAYTDSAVGALVNRLKATCLWDSTLLVMVADHGYPYPASVRNYSPERYHILMMMSGGAIAAPERVETICQQTDLVPTILGEMGADYSAFPLSKDIFRTESPWSFYSYVDGFVLMTQNDTCRIDGRTGNRECGSEYSEKRAKAFMQVVYETIDNL